MNVVVSGASRGIGLALVEAYLDAGEAVIALCRDPAGASDLASLRDQHPKLEILRADVTDGEQVGGVKHALGDRPVDLLVNVAGVFHMETCPEDIDFDAWKEEIETMAIGPFRMVVALLPNIEAARGKVVSLTSQVGASDWDVGGFYSYGAAKAALNRSMKSLAIDLKPRGVTVGLVHPGYVRTAMGGPQGELSAAESAAAIKTVCDQLDLCSTGHFFNWDGTLHAW